ncbi:hypothetical protein M2396_000738 [Pseudomonas sp. BIGb0278]|uniref:hypothetical protein n=1 Tax=Pseudomonas sp. BIGb0278 TaxID=2940607 RepID=UPI0021678937|nr:hypothetical protein [Pseudomonas sp. BIGb0278]MCS4282473.1 hypothetical protein [Pseudomonas sp. BIGb0278]
MSSDANDVLMPDHEMYLQVTAALKRYHEAKDMGAPALEVERLRQIYEAHAQAVTDYQLKALSGRGAPAH